MRIRTAVVPVSVMLLAAVLGGCTQTISGTPGPRPNVSGGGDFPSSTDSPTDESTGSDSPTDSGSPTDLPTDVPTDEGTPTEDGSVASLCADMTDTISGPDLGPDFYKTLISLDIIGWGIGNEDSDPFSTVDAATTAACPDVRTAVLAKTGTPDLKSVES